MPATRLNRTNSHRPGPLASRTKLRCDPTCPISYDQAYPRGLRGTAGFDCSCNLRFYSQCLLQGQKGQSRAAARAKHGLPTSLYGYRARLTPSFECACVWSRIPDNGSILHYSTSPDSFSFTSFNHRWTGLQASRKVVLAVGTAPKSGASAAVTTLQGRDLSGRAGEDKSGIARRSYLGYWHQSIGLMGGPLESPNPVVCHGSQPLRPWSLVPCFLLLMPQLNRTTKRLVVPARYPFFHPHGF